MEPTIANQEPSFKTKLIRGQTGGYGWEITVYGTTTKEDAINLHEEALSTLAAAIAAAESSLVYPAKSK